MTAAGGDLVSVKMLCDLPDNRARGLPVQRSSIMVTSAVTGECIALLDGRATPPSARRRPARWPAITSPGGQLPFSV